MANFCEKCGYPVKHNESFCANCGAALPNINYNYNCNADTNYNTMAIAGFILSICSFFGVYLGIICAILGIIFSAIAKKQIRVRNEKGNSFATAGLVISIIMIVVWTVLLFITGGFILGWFIHFLEAL